MAALRQQVLVPVPDERQPVRSSGDRLVWLRAGLHDRQRLVAARLLAMAQPGFPRRI